jgi:hypothetical protein
MVVILHVHVNEFAKINNKQVGDQSHLPGISFSSFALVFISIPFYTAGTVTGTAVQLPITYYFLDFS